MASEIRWTFGTVEQTVFFCESLTKEGEHRRNVYPPRVSNFGVCFWWLRSANLQTLRGSIWLLGKLRFPKIRLKRLAGYISNPPRSRKSLFVTPKRVPILISPKESCEGCWRGWFSKFFLSLPSQMFLFGGAGKAAVKVANILPSNDSCHKLGTAIFSVPKKKNGKMLVTLSIPNHHVLHGRQFFGSNWVFQPISKLDPQ